MVRLSDNALKQFQDLYSFQGETIQETFKRVAREFVNSEEELNRAYNLLADGYWRPNTPVFLNAGKEEKHKIFSACFVVGLEDSMESIYDVANVARKIFQYGSGIGIPIGNLREKEAYIYEGDRETPPEGKSSGPITFMRLYDSVGETTKSGGRVRRAAILCNMNVWHPDIMEFIHCKKEDGRLANMNISVNITDKFMRSLADSVPFTLRTPSDGAKVGEVDPHELWEELSKTAWETADPGVIFIDQMNKYNPLIRTHLIEATNPCGEQPLLPYSCCNLSAINLGKYAMNGEFDWRGLYNTTFDVMGFMDNLIDKMEYPDERFKINNRNFRQVGIGMMGLADAMYMLDIKYDSQEGRNFASEVMRIMTMACVHKSALLASEKGPFHNYETYKEDMERIIAEHIGLGTDDQSETVWKLVKEHGVRNCQYTTCQPTGTTALSCDASYGMEPIFGLTFTKNYIDGTSNIISNPILYDRFKNEDWFKDNLPERIERNHGSLKGLHGIPKEVREVFIVAHDIDYRERVMMQAALQKYCSTAISSTVNLPKEASPDEVSKLYKYAYEQGLKGITIYRDGSKMNQPITFDKKDDKPELFARPSRLSSSTFRVETGNGKMYVTVSEHKGRPLEVFVQLGKSGQVPNTFTEALGRVISIALQQGVPVEEIVETLRGINSDKPVWTRFEETDKKPSQILSIPDGIAQLLNRYYTGYLKEEDVSGLLCEKCGSSMAAIEGCWTCTNRDCGNSKCS